MDDTELFHLTKEATKLIDENKYSEALTVVQQLKALPSLPSWLLAFYSSGLLIDIGNGLKNREIIEEGKVLLENNIKRIVCVNKLAAAAHYNLGNAFTYSLLILSQLIDTRLQRKTTSIKPSRVI